MVEKLQKSIELRNQKNYSASEKILNKLVNDYPKNAQFYYHYAWLCDNMEREVEVRPKYEKALESGLNSEDLKGCYLGLGSIYRCVGMYKKSIALFDRAIKEFPLNNEYKVFKAMTLYNVENYQEAMNLLFNVVAKTSIDKGIQEYQKAIEYYSDKLEKKLMNY